MEFEIIAEPKPKPPATLQPPEIDNEREPDTDFETAMDACGCGIFNICLLLVCAPGVAATLFETSNFSYILAAAECDLDLTLTNKGMLNAVGYAGMILSAVPWGYIADTVGRKVVLVYGNLLAGLMVLLAACSQNVIQLMVFKFLGGFFVCGPFAVLMSFISEFHSKKHRPRAMLATGIMKTVAVLVLPLLAYFILPRQWNYSISGFKFRSWQVFIAVTGIPSLMCGSLFSLFPESPQFLMSQGRNEAALKAFQFIYRVNTGKPVESYPIRSLHEEAPEKAAKRREGVEDNKKQKFIEGFKQLKPMFTKPYLLLSVMVYLMDFCLLMSQNTLRLWLPQLFVSMAEYEVKYNGSPSLCEVLEYNVNRTQLKALMSAQNKECQIIITPESYINNIIVGIVSFFGYFLAMVLINKLGNQNILSSCVATSTLCAFALYFSSSTLTTLIISSTFIMCSGVAATTVISVSAASFPTIMRTMVIIVVMTSGRLGALLGNILFPFLISTGCILPVLYISLSMLCALVITFVIRFIKTDDSPQRSQA